MEITLHPVAEKVFIQSETHSIGGPEDAELDLPSQDSFPQTIINMNKTNKIILLYL